MTRKHYDNSTAELQAAPLAEIAIGSFVRRKAGLGRVFRVGAYDRSLKRYMLLPEDGKGESLFLSASTLVWIGFEY